MLAPNDGQTHPRFTYFFKESNQNLYESRQNEIRILSIFYTANG